MISSIDIMNILSQTSKAYNQCLRAPSHKVNFLVPKEYPNSKEYTRFLKTNSLPSLSRNATKRSKCIFMLTAQKRKWRVLSCPLSNHISLCLLHILRKNPQKKTSTTSRWRISRFRGLAGGIFSIESQQDYLVSWSPFPYSESRLLCAS